MKKAQTWSIDVMIAVGIFIVVVISFFYIINQSKTTKTEDLTTEGETIPDILISSEPKENLSAVVENIVDQGKLDELAGKSYEDLKKELGIKGDFYIHFEDEEGNIIYINKEEEIIGIGSGEVKIE